MTRHWRALSASAVVAAAALAACSSGSSGTSGGTPSSGPSGVLTVTTGAAGTFTDNFNQFSPNAEDPSRGMIYEPLFFFDTAKAGSVQPWLGTSYSWSNAGKTLTVQLRHDVKWTDGKPFTSADVVYTFNLAEQDAALNENALPLATATASGPYTAVINFTKPSYTQGYAALGKTYILPEHIWRSVPDKSTYLDPNPVGTGAYTVSKVSGQVMELTANPHYYLPGLPKFKTIRFLSYTGNTTSDAAIEQGQLDWAGSFIPNIKTTYLAKNPKFTVVNIPLSTAFLVPNMAKGPTTNLAVRQAISEALDRNYISNTVYNGYAPPSNPSALLTPNFGAVAGPQVGSFGGPNAAAAKSTLARAGIRTPLNLTVKVVTGYTDYISDLQIIQSELKAAGITLSIDSESYAAFIADQSTGNFQLLIDNFGYVPSPWYYYYEILYSKIATPLGQNDTVGNFGRYSNAQVDALLNDIAASPDELSKKQDFAGIEQLFASQLPDIPLFEQQDEIEFNGSNVTGYPTVSNPYAAPAVYISPDLGWVADRLAPVG
ncbi:MAG: ABC transporter substrate-binding protein [Streptosporangiaceae bacterium]|nr:ABC transporter substrate-binding protein [Streptosporangiaceae bacterium]MBV9858032.1 ABC transporter substrate-binding protein [Streptosporangiaceae bacterium]